MRTDQKRALMLVVGASGTLCTKLRESSPCVRDPRGRDAQAHHGLGGEPFNAALLFREALDHPRSHGVCGVMVK